MESSRRLLKNTLLLTAFSLVLRVAGLGFQAVVSRSLGPAGIGLFQLVLSVHGLAVTVATSGVRFAVTRLVAEELGRGQGGHVRSVVRCCFAYAAFFSLLAFVLVFFHAETLAVHWAGDARTAGPIRTLSLGLFFLSFTTVTGGYFTAVGHVGRASLLQLLEQAVMILASLCALPHAGGDMVRGCESLARAAVLSDAVTALAAALVFLADIRRFAAGRGEKGTLSRLLTVSLPLALSAYARTVLSTLQHMLTPAGLKRSGASADEALAVYGTIHGMVFPVLVFPSALFAAIAELMIPELTARQVAGDAAGVERTVNRILKLCLAFSVCCASVLFTFGSRLALLLYGREDVGGYIRLLAPLVIVMYMDTVTDGMLKGLGQQLHSMGINILDAALSLAMVFWLLPVYAVKGYIFILFFSECFNFALSLRRLSRLSPLRLRPGDLLLPLLCALTAVNLPQLMLTLFSLPCTWGTLMGAVALAAVLCFFLLRLLSPSLTRLRPGEGD